MTNYSDRQKTQNLLNEGYKLAMAETANRKAKEIEGDNVTRYEFGGGVVGDAPKEDNEVDDPSTKESLETMASAIVQLTDRLNNMGGK